MLWPKSMKLVDANVILRCILEDNTDMAKQAVKVIEAGAYTKTEIIAEVIYVLQKVYAVQRSEIKDMLNSILSVIYCPDKQSISYAIDLYAQSSFDFVDCLLIAYHSIHGEDVFTFDKKINRFLLRE